jgi:molybdopterin molybdotransferase
LDSQSSTWGKAMGCSDGYSGAGGCDSPDLMSIEIAHAIIHETIVDTVKPISEVQSCPLLDALDRVLAEDIVSSMDVPGYDNSAMDGYAFRYDGLTASTSFIQIGKSFAGNPYGGIVGEGECVRIMTGAVIPEAANTVVMQEKTELNDDKITITADIKKGEAIRLAGSDIAKDSLVLEKGKRLTAIDIGLLASLGVEAVVVYRKLKVAVFSTGDELLAAGKVGKKDHIYDSNRPMLLAMLNRLGADTIDLGIIKDDKALIKQAFELADSQADCVITSGGVSVGEADYTRDILDEIGTINFWKLAIKPGKPLAFGCMENSIFFGLPGNPVSAAVTFEKIVTPSLSLMTGCKAVEKLSLVATAKQQFKKKPGRTDFQRAFCSTDESGALWVESSGTQNSGVLSCFSHSNCYAVLENQRGNVEVGEKVSIQLFDRLMS